MKELMHLRQGRMIVNEYSLMFHQLSLYSLEFMSIMMSRIRKLSFGLSPELIFKSKFALFKNDMDISRLVVYIQ